MAEDADFTDSFCEFLQYSVTAVEAAEVLLLLANAEQAWSSEQIVTRLRPSTNLSIADAEKYLDLFHSRGLIVRESDGQVRYRPQSHELDEHVRMLAKLYNERPVTLIRVIYALRDTKIKSFADAFEFRR